MEKKVTNTLIQYGILSAIVSTLLFVTLYLLGVKAFTSPLAFLSYLIPIIFAVIACIIQKKKQMGYLSFSEALKISFGVFVLTSLATSLFSYVLFNFIDVEFAQAMKEASIEITEKMMKRFGAPQDKIDEAITKAANDSPYTFGKIILGFAISCFVWFLLSALISVIVKRNKPDSGMPQSM